MLKKVKDIQLFTKNQIGVLYMVASVVCFAVMDLCVKWLDYYPFGEVFFARFFFGLIPIFLIIPRNNGQIFIKPQDLVFMHSEQFLGL
jgi:drug/metabolite transporter (DMT)-like permease